MPTWLTLLIALTIFAVIGLGGLAFLRGIAGSRPKEKVDAEDVEALDVYFACTGCGTEYQVTRIGEIQVPRHCGEPMTVVRRPRQQPLNN